jgi:hypothetical protein
VPGEEENHEEFHGSERNDVDNSLTSPIIERGWRAVLPRLETFKLELDGENPCEEMEGKVDSTDTWHVMHERSGEREVQGDIPRVVSIRMLRK